MSTNLHLVAKTEAILNLSKGKSTKTLKERFDLWQTPTEITDKAIASGNPKAVYIEYIRSIEPNDTETMIKLENGFGSYSYYYEEKLPQDAIDLENAPRVQTKTARKEHEELLENWLKEHDGWEIEWEAW